MDNEKYDPKQRDIIIIIGQKKFKVPEPVMIGKEIKILGRGTSEHLLVLVVGKPDPVAGGDDKIIADDEKVELKNDMQFRIVNPATFG